MMLRVLLLGWVVALTCGQHLINSLTLTAQQAQPGCQMNITNSPLILDLRTDCPRGNRTEWPAYSQLLALIPEKKAYFFRREGRQIWGYRFVKDPLNYQFKFYDFQPYHQALAQLQTQLKGQLQVASLSLPFEESYSLNLQHDSASDNWRLSSFSAHYDTPVPPLTIPAGFQGKQELQRGDGGAESLAKRRLAGQGDNQPVNITLQLSASESARVEAGECRVVLEEILPEWFFINYDDLHTVEKHEVFDIELPAHFAKQYYFKYTVDFSRFIKHGPGKFSYQYPMRVRYPPPAEDYIVQVGLHPADSITIDCGEEQWQVEQDLLFDRGHKDMYAGRIADTQLVTLGTYALTVVLTVWTLNQHKKWAEK